MMEMTETEELIAVTYTNWTIETGGQWMRIEELATLTGRSGREIGEAIKSLMSADGFRCEPAPIRKLTPWERANCPIIGGEQRHLICW